jgi:hypothetical protein
MTPRRLLVLPIAVTGGQGYVDPAIASFPSPMMAFSSPSAGVAVRRDPLRRHDDRLGAARAHAPQDEVKQLPHVAAALFRAG